MLLDDGLQIWNALVKSGLEEKRKHDLPGYDAELVATIKGRLYPGATGSFERELRSSPPSPETFLDAFFSALQPFTQMLREVLAMFETAGARRSDENLRIAFNFDKASTALTLTLEDFREVESFFRRIVRPLVERKWNSNTLFSLTQDVRSALGALGVQREPRSSNAQSAIHDLNVREWVERHGRPSWMPFPGFPKSGDPELDKAVGMAEGLIRYMIAEVSKLGPTYQQFSDRLAELPTEDSNEAEELSAPDDMRRMPRRSFVIAAHDLWPNSFAETLCLAIEAVNNRPVNKRAEVASQLATSIRAGFERPPRTERTHVELERDFRDLVNMPIWKKRHELYAVWVASRIADALCDLSWEWHPDGDTLRFTFSGVELATISTGESTHIFWTEKRTALEGIGVFGRKHIQPDYRIMTFPTHRADATSLVVECKQYRKWSRRKFAAALDDYAKGCPKAPIILVNYGPADQTILARVDASRRERTFIVGNFTPVEEPALDRFRDLVRMSYSTFLNPSGGCLVELRWGPMFHDLDLHLIVKRRTGHLKPSARHFGFGSTPGSLTEEPWVQWSGDVQASPPGVEQIEISRWLNAEYEVLVHDYSGSPSFPSGEVSVRIVLGPGGEERLFTPPSDVGRWWHVCRIQGPSGKIRQINRVGPDSPYPVH